MKVSNEIVYSRSGVLCLELIKGGLFCSAQYSNMVSLRAYFPSQRAACLAKLIIRHGNIVHLRRNPGQILTLKATFSRRLHNFHINNVFLGWLANAWPPIV